MAVKIGDRVVVTGYDHYHSHFFPLGAQGVVEEIEPSATRGVVYYVIRAEDPTGMEITQNLTAEEFVTEEVYNDA